MIAYKVFNPGWTCKGFQYEVGKTYHLDGELIMCVNGFHACKKAVDCFNYYNFARYDDVEDDQILGYGG